MNYGGANAFSCGEANCASISLPLASLLSIGKASPSIDNDLAAMDYVQSTAPTKARGKIACE